MTSRAGAGVARVAEIAETVGTMSQVNAPLSFDSTRTASLADADATLAASAINGVATIVPTAARALTLPSTGLAAGSSLTIASIDGANAVTVDVAGGGKINDATTFVLSTAAGQTSATFTFVGTGAYVLS